MTDAVVRNPHLPEAPADGRHDFNDQPADIGGNHRCLLCGAYQGSDEAGEPCRGEYAESGKMRSWAESRWMLDQVREWGVPRAVFSTTEERILVQHRVVSDQGKTMEAGGGESHVLMLACGHRVALDFSSDTHLRLWERLRWSGGEVVEVGCARCHETRNFGRVVSEA